MRTLVILALAIAGAGAAPAQAPTMVLHPAAEMQWKDGPLSLPKGAQMMVLEGPLVAGSFGYWPAGTPHFALTASETILQLHGQGPWTIQYVNPADDPRGVRP